MDKGLDIPGLFGDQLEQTIKPRDKRPLGRFTPRVWVIEPTHGCNLRCAHCSCRLDPLPKKYHFISEASWTSAFEIMAKVSPYRRVDICLGGEPTLHPGLVDLLCIARDVNPTAQIQITTNGTMLLSGKIRLKQLLDAGANIIYVDMYGPSDDFKRLAKEAGVLWYEYYNKPKSAPSPWMYHGPDTKMVILQEQPENWPVSRRRANLLGTWYNHLDWDAARKFGLTPVVNAPHRRCNQPFHYVPVDSRGNYLLCCQDNTGETAGMFGNVDSGIDGFLKYWLGETMQTYRRNLMVKDRKANSQCSRCSIAFSRCDLKHYTDEQLSFYWDRQWYPFDQPIRDNRPKIKGLFD